MIKEEDIFRSLELVGVPSEKARQRAKWLMEDIAWIGLEKFTPVVEHSGLRDLQGKSIPIAEYNFGSTAFSVDNAARSTDKRATSIGGSLLDRGNLRYFSIISEIGRQLLPHLWLSNADLKHYLQTPHTHLDALNEVWWLGRFPTAVDVRPRHKMHLGAEDIDWRFRLDGTDVWINLEVKNRPSDISRAVHGKQIGAGKWFQGAAKKFAPSSKDEFNIIGLTLFGEIDRHVQLEISSWLRRCPVIDGVLIWAYEGRRKTSFDKQLKENLSQILEGDAVARPVEEQEIILRYWAAFDRRYWPKELSDWLPPDL